MEQRRLDLDDPHRGVTIVVPDRDQQLTSEGVRLDPLLQLGPVREPVLACEDELRVGETERPGGDRRIVRRRESRVSAADALQGVAVALAPFSEKLARLAFRNVEMRPIGQIA
jgi:hypothetical protein